MLFCSRLYKAGRNQLTARVYSPTIRMYGTATVVGMDGRGNRRHAPASGRAELWTAGRKLEQGAGAKTPPTIDCRNDIALHRDFMKGLVVLGEGWATYAWSFGMRASRANHSFKFAALPVTVAWVRHVPECWPASSRRDPTTRVRRRDRERCSSSNIADNLAFGIGSYRAIRFPVTCRYPQRVVRE